MLACTLHSDKLLSDQPLAEREHILYTGYSEQEYAYILLILHHILSRILHSHVV